MVPRLKKFCVVCGNEKSELIEGLCEECYNKRFPKVRIAKREVIVKRCVCNRVKLDKGGWIDASIEDIIEKAIEKNVSVREDVELEAEYDMMGDCITVKLFEKDKKDKLNVFVIRFRDEKCPRCAAYLGGYYEATIQIRGTPSFIQDVLNLVEETITKEKKDEKAFVAEYEEVRGGMDVKLGSRRIASKITSLAKKYKNAEVKYSKKLKTKKKGKEIFRYTYLIREVKNEKGQKR